MAKIETTGTTQRTLLYRCLVAEESGCNKNRQVDIQKDGQTDGHACSCALMLLLVFAANLSSAAACDNFQPVQSRTIFPALSCGCDCKAILQQRGVAKIGVLQKSLCFP